MISHDSAPEDHVVHEIPSWATGEKKNYLYKLAGINRLKQMNAYI